MLCTNYRYICSNGHLGRVRLVLYYLYSYTTGLYRPAPLRMWEATIKYCKFADDAYEIACAFTYATMAGMTNEHQDLTSNGHVPHLIAYLTNLHKSWGIRQGTFAKEVAASLQLLQQQLGTDGDPDQYASAMREMCAIRRFFVTRDGRLGIGPSGLRSGDVVTILFGSGVPMILRKRAGRWLLVGDCYIHGLIEGQAIDRVETGAATAQWFNIH